MSTIILPWPAKQLHPNARVHWAVRAKHARKAREDGYFAAKAAGVAARPSGVALGIVFYPPNARRRDLDGCLSALKSALDGIADALGVDDSRFAINMQMGDPVEGGRVEVSL